jgi:hypothetical protein
MNQESFIVFNTISSFFCPDFKPVHGSENLDTGRPLTLERIATESREPKNAANWDVHYFKKICHDLGIKMDDIQNAEAALPLNKKFILETLPSTHLVRIPSDSTAKPISASKESISSYYLTNALHGILKNSSEFTKTDKKYILIGTAITLSLALLSGGLALFSGASLAITILLIGLDVLHNISFLYWHHSSNRSILLQDLSKIFNKKNLSAYTKIHHNRSNAIHERLVEDMKNVNKKTWYFLPTFFIQISAIYFLINPCYALIFLAIKLSLFLCLSTYDFIKAKKSVAHLNHLNDLISKSHGKLELSNTHTIFESFVDDIRIKFNECPSLSILISLGTDIITNIILSMIHIPLPLSITGMMALPAPALLLVAATCFGTIAFLYGCAQTTQKDYDTFFKDIQPAPTVPTETLPNIDTVNSIVLRPENSDTDILDQQSTVIEKIKIDDTISRKNIEKLLEMKHLKAIDIDLSKSPDINLGEIDLRLQQKITHLKCTGEQIRNIDLTEPSSSLPQLTHLDILNPLDENFKSFICNPQILPTLKCLKMEQELYQPILQELAWPETLTELQLMGFRNRELPQLPQNLTSLILKYLLELDTLPEQLPQNLASLTLKNLDNLESVPQQLPQSLACLTLSGLRNLHILPQQLPQSLACLTLSGLRNLHILPQQLPQNLASLTLNYLHSLRALPQQLPQSLVSLTLSGLDSLCTLPQQLPQSLASLTLKQLEDLEALPQQLPQNLASLTLHRLPKLYTLPQQLPQNLVSLTLLGLHNLRALPQQLPQNLASLTLNWLPNLHTLPEQLPPNLASLTLKDLPSLRILPKELSQNIRHLNFNIDPELIRISSTENRPDTI